MRVAYVMDGMVVGILELESLEGFEGLIMIPSETANVGDLWDGQNFTTPVPPPPPVRTSAEIVLMYMSIIRAGMNERAKAYGYEDIISVISYADEPAIPRYQTEGQAFRAWRSMCRAKCEQICAALKAGERTDPTEVELVAEMPELDLPPPSLS